MDLLEPFFNPAKVIGAPDGYLCTWLPVDTDTRIAAGKVLIRVYRGGLSAGNIIDAGAVQVAVIAQTRADAWAALEYIRQILRTYERGGTVPRLDGSKTLITHIREMTGPQELPELNPDDRLVPATFAIETRRTIPNYLSNVLAALGL